MGNCSRCLAGSCDRAWNCEAAALRDITLGIENFFRGSTLVFSLVAPVFCLVEVVAGT